MCIRDRPGDSGDGNVQDVEILPSDQIQQQIQRPLEGFQKDFQGVRRDVEIPRQLRVGFAADSGERRLSDGVHLSLIHI